MKRALEQRLSQVAGFEEPSVKLEQYPTPANLAAHLVHLADLQDDLGGRTVVDLGTGTGMLALGAATRSPARVLGLDIDANALALACKNEAQIDPSVAVNWIHGDATRHPICTNQATTTVLMNPPFGAQRGHRHADRQFLETAANTAGVSYSIHNEGSQNFVESFAADNAGEVTHAFRATFPVKHQFDFHTAEREELTVEVFRIDWAVENQL